METLFLQHTIKRFKNCKQLADKTFEQLEENDFFYQPNEASNSIAIIIQHMHGNMLSRWTNFLTEDGEKEWRTRDAEFKVAPFTKEQLLNLWNDGWNCLLNTLESLQPADLEHTIHIRTEPLKVFDAILRQLAHYPYHVGQIVYIGRMIKDNAWQSLSVAKGESKQFNEQMKAKHQ